MEAMLLSPHCTLGGALGFNQDKAEFTMLSSVELCLKYLNVDLYSSVSVKYIFFLHLIKFYPKMSSPAH